MTNEQINIAIAETCGWTNVAHDTVFSGRKIGRGIFGNSPFGGEYRLIPDYCADLNAMHEAEKVLTADQWYEYDRLMPLRDPQKIHATARQRAEGFLRTIGKWKEAAK